MTNTVSVGKVYDALFLWQLEQGALAGDDEVQIMRRVSIPIVAETFDGLLNNISASVVDKQAVYDAIEASKTQTETLEGNYGGGTAMRCHGYKGGTGTSSRIVPGADRDYTLGVLVQANHGQKDDLRIGNVPVGEFLVREEARARAASKKEETQFPKGGKAAEGSEFLFSCHHAGSALICNRHYNRCHVSCNARQFL